MDLEDLRAQVVQENQVDLGDQEDLEDPKALEVRKDQVDLVDQLHLVVLGNQVAHLDQEVPEV